MNDPNTSKGLQVAELRSLYDTLRRKHGSYELYNLLEKCVIEVALTPADEKFKTSVSDLDNVLIKEIKGLAMQISRFNPTDWNKFLDVVIK